MPARLPKDFLQMTKDVLDFGVAEVTCDRFVWKYSQMARLTQAIAAIMHDSTRVSQAMGMPE